MDEIKCLKKVDNFITLNNVIVSCENKIGLVSNIDADGNIIDGIPSNGILGLISSINQEVKFISSGGTYKLLKSSGLNVTSISEYTSFPEMNSGLVTSLHPKIHGGILGHRHTKEDDQFINDNKMLYFDAVIVNFSPLDTNIIYNKELEEIRKFIDVGGTTMCNSARKAFLSTALITSPSDYQEVINELINYNGRVSVKLRLELAKKASSMITPYMISIDKIINTIELEDLFKSYEIIG